MAILPLQLARVSRTLRTSVATKYRRHSAAIARGAEQLSTGKRSTRPATTPGRRPSYSSSRRRSSSGRLIPTNPAANNQLGEVDSTLSDLTDLLQQAQTIASPNVGPESRDQRATAAAVVQSLYDQAMSLANKQFEGAISFGGDDRPPHRSSKANGVKFVGSTKVLQNQYDENTSLSFQVDGTDVFGALSSQCRARSIFRLSLTPTTLIRPQGRQWGRREPRADSDQRWHEQATMDLSTANSVGDVVTAINNAGIGSITASTNGQGITLNSGGAANITVNEVGGGTTARDLGILTTTGAGAGVDVTGTSLPTIRRYQSR